MVHRTPLTEICGGVPILPGAAQTELALLRVLGSPVPSLPTPILPHPWGELTPPPRSPVPPQATLKKYQSEHRAKVEAIEKCQAELKKLRKKCQSSKNPQKYGDREVQVRGGVGLGWGGP